MTASALAKLLHARRTGKGKWVAKCPSHPDRNPSLSIAEGKKGVLLRCMSHGCETSEILNSLHLTWADLFNDKPPDRKAMEAIEAERERAEEQKRTRRRMRNLALYCAAHWNAVSEGLGKRLAGFPGEDDTARRFHQALAYSRRAEAIADALDHPCCRGMGFPKSPLKSSWPSA